MVGFEDPLGVVLNGLQEQSAQCLLLKKGVTCLDSGVGVGALSPFWLCRRGKDPARPQKGNGAIITPGPLSQAPVHRSSFSLFI